MVSVKSVVIMNKFVKKSSLLGICLALLMCLAGCGQKSSWPQDGKLPVVASFYPVAFLTEQIGGDKVDVHTMVPAGSEPHVWEPTPSDLVNVGNSKLFVYLGLGMDAWAPDMLSSLGKDAPVSVVASDGVDPLTFEQERELVADMQNKSHHDDHDHDHDEDKHKHADHKEHAHEEEHNHSHEGHSHAPGGIDPHVWLDPARAKIMGKNILAGLISVDPANKEYYENNYNALALKLDEIDAAYEENLSGFTDKKIVV